MNKKFIISGITALMALGGVVAFGTPKGASMQDVKASTGVSTITFNLPTVSSTAFGADGSHANGSLLSALQGNGTTPFITAFSAMAYVYSGNAAGSGPGLVTNAIKIGKSATAGTLTISTQYLVSQVVINWCGWSATKNSQLVVGGVAGTPAARLTFAEETFTLPTSTSSLTIASIIPSGGDARLLINSIALYHTCVPA